MVITFSPPGSQAPSSSEVEMEWEPTTSEDAAPRLLLDRDNVIPDSQEDQDDVFSPLPKGTMIPDSEEDSNMTLTHVLAKRLYDQYQMHLSDLGAENESDIWALVLKPTTLLPEPPATFRVDYFPFMMRRILMAHPDGVTGCAAVAYTERPSLGGLQYVPGPNATSQFGPDFFSGTIWTFEFVPGLDTDSLSLRPWALRSDLELTLPLQHFVFPHKLETWVQKMRRRREWLVYICVWDKAELHVGDGGSYYYECMPLENEAHLIPPSAISNILMRALRNPANRLIVIQDPVVPDLVVQGIIARLMQRPKLCHVAWGRALEGLEAMAAAATGLLDALGILEELNNAKANCEGDWETLAEPARAASDDIEVLLVEPRVTKWVAQFMCRLIGVDAGPQSDEKWWTGDSQPREAAAAVGKDLYMRIDQTFRRLMAGHVVKATRTAPGLTPAAEAERDAKAHDLAGRALA
ncbi:hypothetical protein LRP88_12507 [Fusarium phalaenopsidis]